MSNNMDWLNKSRCSHTRSLESDHLILSYYFTTTYQLWLLIVILCYCPSNHNNYRSVKQHKCIMLLLGRLEVQIGSQPCWQGWGPSCRVQERISLLIQGLAESSTFVVRLRFLFPCWLLAEDSTWLLVLAHRPLFHKQSSGVLNPHIAMSLILFPPSSLSLTKLESVSLLKTQVIRLPRPPHPDSPG